MSARGGGIEHLFNVQVGLPGIHPPLGNGDKGFAPPVLGQAQDSPGVALGQAIVQHELPLVGGQLQQPQLVGKGGLCHAQPLGRLGLGAVPKGDHIPQPLCLLKGVQVFPLDVFQQTQRRSPLVAAVAEDSRNGLHPGQLTGTEPPLPCHQLVTTFDLPHRDGLQQAVFPDALGQPRQLLFIKNSPSLKRRGTDAFHRQGVDLSGRFLPFKHDSFPFR